MFFQKREILLTENIETARCGKQQHFLKLNIHVVIYLLFLLLRYSFRLHVLAKRND